MLYYGRSVNIGEVKISPEYYPTILSYLLSPCTCRQCLQPYLINPLGHPLHLIGADVQNVVQISRFGKSFLRKKAKCSRSRREVQIVGPMQLKAGFSSPSVYSDPIKDVICPFASTDSVCSVEFLQHFVFVCTRFQSSQ